MIAENQKVELFDEFYNWLVDDGLKANKSERLHRKKIFASLMANDEMTLDNFYDFLAFKNKETKLIDRIKNLENQEIFFKNSYRCITKIQINKDLEEFQITTLYIEREKDEELIINCKFQKLEEIEKIIKKGEF